MAQKKNNKKDAEKNQQESNAAKTPEKPAKTSSAKMPVFSR